MKLEKKNFPENITLNDASRFTAQITAMLASLIHQDATVWIAENYNNYNTHEEFLHIFKEYMASEISKKYLSAFDIYRIELIYAEVFKEETGISAVGDEALVAEAKAKFDSITKGGPR